MKFWDLGVKFWDFGVKLCNFVGLEDLGGDSSRTQKPKLSHEPKKPQIPPNFSTKTSKLPNPFPPNQHKNIFNPQTNKTLWDLKELFAIFPHIPTAPASSGSNSRSLDPSGISFSSDFVTFSCPPCRGLRLPGKLQGKITARGEKWQFFSYF